MSVWYLECHALGSTCNVYTILKSVGLQHMEYVMIVGAWTAPTLAYAHETTSRAMMCKRSESGTQTKHAHAMRCR
jgi:hypothetical protein